MNTPIDTGDAGPSKDQEEAPKKSRLRGVALNLLLLGFSTALALVAAEIGIRIVSPQQLIVNRPDIWIAADSVGWRNRSNVDTEVNTGERTVRLISDDEGFRVGTRGRQTAGDSILLIGDSFMAALQVEYEQSLAGLLEDSLRGPDAARASVRNAGVDGWDTPHYLLFTKNRLLANTYGLILVSVYVGNDVVRQVADHIPPRHPEQRSAFRIPRSLYPAEWVDAIARPVNDLLEERSHAFVFTKNRSESLRIKLGLSVASVPSGILVDRAEGEQWETTADALAELASLGEASGTPVLFFLIPDRYQVDTELFDSHLASFGLDRNQIDIDQPNRRLSEEMTERGLTVIDALPVLREAHLTGPQLFGSVDAHLSPRGHLVIYELLEPSIRERLWP